MKLFILIVAFFNLTSYSQNEIKELQTEIELLERIQKNYEAVIDSLYDLPQTDSSQILANKLVTDYYILKAENIRSEMRQIILLIDALNTIKKED